MGLQSALTTALTGLQAAETTIDIVGNNVANSQTVGFKESEAIFATQFLQTLSIGSAPSTNSGGTNPRQIGLGVKVAEISPKFTQGTIEISSNPLDVAIQGDGFLVVQSGNGELYTRNGQLKLNGENEIVTATGQRVLGFGVNDDFELQKNVNDLKPLTIPLGKERVSQATRNASFSGVLNPSVSAGETPSITQSIVLGDGTVPQPQAADSNFPFDINDFPEAEAPNSTNVVGSGTGAGNGPDSASVLYKFVFTDGAGNASAPSGARTLAKTAGQETFDLTAVPSGAGSIWTGPTLVYRQESAGSEFRLVGQAANGTSTFSDTVNEADLAATDLLDEEVMEPGSYSYYVSYYSTNAQVETRPTARIGTRSIAAPGGRIRIDLSDLETPTHPDYTFDQIRIYRNLSNSSSDYRRVHDAIIPAGTTTFIDKASNSELQGNPAVDLNGPGSNDNTPLVDLVVRVGETYVTNFFKEGNLTFQAEKDGVDVEAKTLEITSSTDVLALMKFMRETLGITPELSGDTSTAAGNITLDEGKIIITSNLGTENAIEVPLTAFKMEPADGSAISTLPIAFNETQQADGPGTTTEMIVYDSLGLPLNVRITTVLETKNANETVYRWYATSGDNEPFSSEGVSTVIGDGLLRFDSNGDLIPGDSRRISIQRNITASESPLEVELDFSQIKALGETDAQGNAISTLNLSSQDGFPPGVLTDFIITNDGTIQGQFSNGTQRTVGQIVMARFANAGGLQQVGDSMFNIGVNSGVAIKGVPGGDGIGSLTAGAVELSNTDIGQNLIELILASTQYRGGARVITATQELLDELLALSR